MSTVSRRRRGPAPTKEGMRSVVVIEPVVASSYFKWYGIVNRLAAALLLILAAPVILITLVVVRLTSRGNPLYKQTRVGRGGRVFTIYKIRSMRIDAEARTGAVWTTTKHDPRITPVGRFLRTTHLDELPQLLNVIKGEMALVGPRPERPEFTEALADEIEGYLDRLHVLPGVTGLAQVNLPPDVDLNSVRDKLVLDLKYVTQGSLWLDVRIVLATVLAMMAIPGEWVNRILRIEHGVNISNALPQVVEERDGQEIHSVQLSKQHAQMLRVMTQRS
jgi:lipopolysaccharide/colanic/teichoic acid biosynthesis glycosyltransferase